MALRFSTLELALAGAAADAVRQAEQRFALNTAIEVDPGCERDCFQISAL